MKFLNTKTTKTVAIALSACVICGAMGVAYSANSNSEYESALENVKAANEATATAMSILGGASVGTERSTDESTGSVIAGKEVGKDETVYVMADAQGAVSKVIVSDELKNPTGAATLADKSGLQDITNIKGSENYTKNSDGTITWNAQGNEIYYQGTSDKTLPIQVKIKYTLDGKEISADKLAGKSGKVVIRYDYNIDKSVLTEKGNTAVPFLTLTGMMLDNNIFSNITVSNGKIVDDSDHSIVIGFALPGVKEALNQSKELKDVPEYVEVTADVKNFALGSTLTYASCDFANDIDSKNINSIDDLTGALTQVSSAVTQLSNGSSTLYDGLRTLLEKSGQMTSGIGTLYSGATEVSTGLATLDSNSATLKSGAYQVFTTLTATAQTQLNAALTANGMSTVTLTPETYSTVIGGLLDKLSGGAYSQAKSAAEAQVRPAVQAAVLAQVTSGVKDTVKAAAMAKGNTEEQAVMYLQSSEGVATINAAVAQKMASDEIKQTIESTIAAKLASAEVQTQINTAVSSGLSGNASYSAIKSLKASIDSYAAFYSGLSTYTSGVSTAAGGAKKIAGGLGTLKTNGDSFVSGVTQLRDGAMQLSDGMSQFVNQLTAKLGSLSGSEIAEVLPKISSMLDAAKNYNNYSGISNGTTGSVKFIINVKRKSKCT